MKKLYEAASCIKELKPWEKFWDLDLIGIRYGEKEKTVFFSILGRGGNCYGIVVYEGYEGVNSFLMLNMQESLNLSPEYVLIGFIFRFGAPKEIRVSNIIVEAGIEQICDVCGIKIRRIKRLKGLEEFKDSYTIEKYYFENREQKLGETYGYFLINIWIFSD